MIARIAIPIVLLILLSHAYFDHIWWRKFSWPMRLLCWTLPIAIIAFVVWLAFLPDYFPRSIDMLIAFLHLLLCYIVPSALTALGLFLARRFHKRLWAFTGLGLSVITVAAWLYGFFIGFAQFEVRRVEIAFDDLPTAFDGYRIVQFSDAHLGTLTGSRKAILQRAVDSINAQHADLIVFTGDLQNMRPKEIEPHVPLLKSLKATDGVYSVMGNHDGSYYIKADDITKAWSVEKTIGLQQDMDWHVLINTRNYIHRGGDSIVIAGMANDGEGRFPAKGDIQNTLWGVNRSQFVVMLEHDPSSWRRKILRKSHAQLTLSGHTHAGQLSLFGWSPVSVAYSEYDGLYQQGQRCLFVSRGLGGVVPFRLGAPGEIVVITLRSKSKKE